MTTRPDREQRWCTADLWYAAQQLRVIGALLEAVADDHRGLGQLTASEPEVHAAMQHFLDQWELPLWSFGQEAASLADRLQDASIGYSSTESEFGRAMTNHARFPWSGCT
ncbi:MAG: hypothetical protein ACXVFU_16975 [Nocardioidaceae bacterium]